MMPVINQLHYEAFRQGSDDWGGGGALSNCEDPCSTPDQPTWGYVVYKVLTERGFPWVDPFLPPAYFHQYHTLIFIPL